MRVLALSVCLLAALPVTARADAISDFESARIAYEEQQYEDAAARLERLVADTAQDAVSTAIVLESRKYLAASYLFLGRPREAQQQLVLLLRQEPEYELDPVRFPRDVLEAFEAARRQVDQERRAEAERRETERRRAEEERRRLEAEYRASLERLTTETVLVPNSRALALMPFGVGQFRNGHRGLGVFFAVSESLVSVSALTSFLVHFRLRYVQNPGDVSAFRDTERRANIINWSSVGVFGALAIAGAIDAQVRFVPAHTVTRPRAVDPAQLPPPPPPRPVTSLGIGPGTLRLRVDF